MVATSALTADLAKQVLLLEEDLRERLTADAVVLGRWRHEHHLALERERTAASWEAWRDDRVTQVAVAWGLATVFVRFCEDNRLVGPVWISGPAERRQEALDAQLAFFRSPEHQESTDREWLQSAIDHLAGLRATASLFAKHSPLWLLSPSGHAITALLDFWRRRGDDGALVHDLADPELSTRFLGDLYQDLSAHARETFALLQTPEFVEEFILDRTMEPALAERPLEGFKGIDPTCGSGHFLLGMFDRLLDRWHRAAPAMEPQARVQKALDGVYGVDLNPFAVAIARFRLTVAALKAVGLPSLEDAPAWEFHLAAGDSLIHGVEDDALPGLEDRSRFMAYTYATEDADALARILRPGSYDCVVGNPPYITVKDKTLNQVYRAKYGKVCKGTYALTVPFMVRFFDLAKTGAAAGWVGQITSNSFMKREFGAPLIEEFLARKDLRLVADTSGAYIPGHGTPTVILVGRPAAPESDTVRAVLGVRGEPGRPEDPAKGQVWTSIVEHVDTPGWEDAWVTIADLARSLLAGHPWSLSGGGAADVSAKLASAPSRHLRSVIAPPIGRSIRAGADEAFMRPTRWRPKDVSLEERLRPFLMGDLVRDWAAGVDTNVLYPYVYGTVQALDGGLAEELWPWRALLSQRGTFSGNMADAGLAWWEYMQHTASAYTSPLSMAFAFVATHNHFVLDRGGKVFNRSAPVIKLPAGATEDEHLALLGLLNSSTACFWLKQNSQSKAGSGIGRGIQPEDWMDRYEFTGTTLEDYPLPTSLPRDRGQLLDLLAQDLSTVQPNRVCADGVPSSEALGEAGDRAGRLLARMVAVQEELDWETYRLYGLLDEDHTYAGGDLPGLALGERAFEIALARKIAVGEETTAWFARHGSAPITDVPVHWPDDYKNLVERRLELIASDPNIRLLERPEYKRRWATEPWEKKQERAVRGWLLDRLEDKRFWFDGQGRPLPRSVAQLADEVARDDDLVSALALWEGRPDVPVVDSLKRLLTDEAVPHLAAYRYKDSGLRKRQAWEHTWALQRREDAGEKVGTVPVPPKYTSADFRRASYWQARGKLDVPKERFIAYPDAGRETDPTPLLGWAGWDHAQQSLALSLIIGDREREGWPDDRLVPLVAGLAELQPWVDQWHADVDPTYGVSLAAFCREQLTARAAQVGKTLDDLAAWRPPTPTRGRRAAAPAPQSRP